MYLHYGIKNSVDSVAYHEASFALLNGIVPSGRDIWYTSYFIFIAGISLIGGDSVIVLMQLLLSGVALCCIYRSTNIITDSRRTAFFAGFPYIVWIKIHQWNFYIYTESLFTSMSIISFASLVLSKTVKQYVFASLIFLFTFFIRPTGVALLAGLLIYGFALNYQRVSKNARLMIMSIILISGIILINFMMNDFNFINSYQKAEIIYPNISLGLNPPKKTFIPSEDSSPIVTLIQFIYYNPIYFFSITVIKFLLFIGNVKPYFSPLHNAVIIVILYPLYFFALKGFRYFAPNQKEHYFIAGFVIAQCAIVSLTSENWDGRFLIPILPFVFILSAVGINQWFSRVL